MILDFDDQALHFGIEAGTFWHCPALEDTIELQPEIVMPCARMVQLHDKNRFLVADDLLSRRWLCRLSEVSSTFVFIQFRHTNRIACRGISLLRGGCQQQLLAAALVAPTDSFRAAPCRSSTSLPLPPSHTALSPRRCSLSKRLRSATRIEPLPLHNLLLPEPCPHRIARRQDSSSPLRAPWRMSCVSASDGAGWEFSAVFWRASA